MEEDVRISNSQLAIQWCNQLAAILSRLTLNKSEEKLVKMYQSYFFSLKSKQENNLSRT